MFKVKQLALILVVLGVLVYIPSWFNGFVWDDEEQIVNNPFIKNFSGISQVFSGSTFGGGGSALPSGGYYKPLMSVWYMLNSVLFGDWAGGFHLSQSLLHGINGAMFFLILNQLTKKRGLAFGAPLLWIIHPGNVESVAYAASAQEVLASFFGLLALYVVVKRKQWKMDEITSLFVAALLILPSLLSKEAGAVFPLVISAYLLVVEREGRLAKFYSMLLIPVILVYCVLRFGVAHLVIEPNPIIPVAQLSLGERFLTVPETLWQHIRVTFMPVVLFIGHHQVYKQFSLRTGWQLMVIIGLLGGMGWINYRQKNRPAWFFWIWLILATGIVSNIYPLDMTYAERWSYMPILAMVGWSVMVISEWKNMRVMANIWKVGIVILVLFSLRTVMRQTDWHDGLRLYGTDIKYAAKAFDLQNNYGVELMRADRMEEAKGHFEKSIELSPKWWTPPNNLGVVYQRMGDEDKAIELYRKSIGNGDYFLAYENLATLLVQREDSKAVEVVEAGLKLYPYNQQLLRLAYYLSSR